MRFRKSIGTASAVAIMGLGAVVGTAGPAAAAHTCGTVINETSGTHYLNQYFAGGVSGCVSKDGLTLSGSNYTLNLQGQTISAASPNGPGDNAGIRLDHTTNVTVINGTVVGFDAGVAIVGSAPPAANGSSGNKIQSMTLKDNINPGGPGEHCDFGDGAVMFNSSNNQVLNSNIQHNGPYSGAAFVENADGNLVRQNQILDNNVDSGCDSGLDAGVRVEGPGANFNRVESNTIDRSQFFGVGLFENIAGPSSSTNPACQLANPSQPPNTDNFVVNNNIRLTAGTSDSGGIGGPSAGLGGACAAIRTTITGNTVAANAGAGIKITATSHDNVINKNAVNSNGRYGIELDGPIFRNTFTNVGPTVFEETSPTPTTYTSPDQFVVLSGSGSGNVTARLVPVGPINVSGTIPFDSATSGCSSSDFAGFPAGAVALVQRGNCARSDKADNAVAAGASAVVMFNEGSAGRTGVLTFGAGVQPIPVLGTSFAVGQALYNQTQAGPVTVHIVTNTTNVPSQIGNGAVNNILNANRGTANARPDGADFNVNCDNNAWTANIFSTVNQPCVKAGNGTGTVTGPIPA